MNNIILMNKLKTIRLELKVETKFYNYGNGLETTFNLNKS